MQQIPGFPYHWVEETGRVINTWGKYPQDISTKIDSDGYLAVVIQYKGISRQLRVHRLVAEAYIPNPNNLPIVRHKDHDRTNPHFSNLEWGTHQDNMDDIKCRNRLLRDE